MLKKVHFLSILSCICLTFVMPLKAEIYTWKDDKGKVHFSDKAPEDRQSKTVQVEVKGAGLGLATEGQRQQVRYDLSREAELAEKRRQEQLLSSRDTTDPESTPAKSDDDKDRPPMLTDQMTEEECKSKYRKTCEEVKQTLQANIQKCLDNRGGKRCHEFDYQMKRLMPLTKEDWDGIGAAQQANIRRHQQELDNMRYR